MLLPASFKSLVDQISKLPGIGKKSASRIAIRMIEDKEYGIDLNTAISTALRNCVECEICGNLLELSEDDVDKKVCEICSAAARNEEILCIVQTYSDLLSIEDAGFFDGKYHIIRGVISPLDGVYEEDLNLLSLYKRIKENSKIKEIIYSIPPGLEADATYMIIKNALLEIRPILKFSRFAVGLPVGSSIDFVDGSTIFKAYENRILDSR